MPQSKLSHSKGKNKDTARRAGAKARLTSDKTNIKSYSPVEHLELLMKSSGLQRAGLPLALQLCCP